MASMQKSREQRAQAAAQKAADELHASRQDRVPEEAPVSPRGGGGILGSLQEGKANARGVADAAMGKASETKDAAADKAGGVRDAAADRTGNNKAGAAESEEDVMLRVKAADQMTGQAFNDVGTMGEEGTGVPRRRRSG
ncbi:hypothetical protein Zm00014a_023659 [Zea mays]|jgi:hypothetical protein|uniref:Embryonic protein DC-8 n=2 Tax=Zea mays TaxID=4577 RepID=K7UNW7_MAIZE|nr:embryonic protein DC-8 [Zea mays]AQK89286.1 Embryonic protein DC-8 [Zea mays]PWZ10421.1 hypothetical protein Zm00014a_023659 [Zea mays]|eukprot:NP_001152687.2 embryonic protein DC-8 [Zea mays]